MDRALRNVRYSILDIYHAHWARRRGRKIMDGMSKQRILVVDDGRGIVKVVRSYLEQAGYDVQSAYSGTEARHALRSSKPDPLVLDLMLPDRDGWEITRLLRAD